MARLIVGRNDSGQLGDGSLVNTNIPVLIVPDLPPIVVTAIATESSARHSLVLKSDGSLWAMGDDFYGELGDGANNITNRPEMIVLSGVTAISAGGDHSLFLKSDGSLWAMGWNNWGQLGDGTVNRAILLPEQIVAGSIVSPSYKISAQLLSGGNVRLSFVGIAGEYYALDRTFNLEPANWVPQMTNPAGTGGVLVFANTPNPTTNNFWRIRFVP